MAGQPEIQPRKRGRPTAEERRARESEILSNVLCVFLLCGYGASTVDELAAAAQVTKRTLYTYYGDKAGLFAAMVTDLAATVSLDATRDDDTLEVLAARIVSRVHSDELVGLHRLVIAESARFPELAVILHSSGDARHIARLAEHIRAECGPASEPLAEPLFSLLLGEKHRRRLLGIDPAPTPAEAAGHARAALAQLGLRLDRPALLDVLHDRLDPVAVDRLGAMEDDADLGDALDDVLPSLEAEVVGAHEREKPLEPDHEHFRLMAAQRVPVPESEHVVPGAHDGDVVGIAFGPLEVSAHAQPDRLARLAEIHDRLMIFAGGQSSRQRLEVRLQFTEGRRVVAREPDGALDELQPSLPGVARLEAAKGGHGVVERAAETEGLAIQQELVEVAVADLGPGKRVNGVFAELRQPKGGANAGSCGLEQLAVALVFVTAAQGGDELGHQESEPGAGEEAEQAPAHIAGRKRSDDDSGGDDRGGQGQHAPPHTLFHFALKPNRPDAQAQPLTARRTLHPSQPVVERVPVRTVLRETLVKGRA